MHVTITSAAEGKYQTIILDKPVGGRPMYRYEVQFEDKIVSRFSGVVEDKEIFKDVNYNLMEVRVYDVEKDEMVYYRKYHLKEL